jgi:8-oxo-dGTP pyrophosphatase MutT (NUDIX family)
MTEHVHNWGDWRKEFWYVAGGRYIAKVRKCKECPTVQVADVDEDKPQRVIQLNVDDRPAVVRPTIGIYAGIFNEEGKLLLRRRPVGGSSPGEWELPGGGVDADNSSKALDERIVIQELAREVKEETGISIPSMLPMVAMYPAVLRSGGDWAFAILVGVVKEKPSKRGTRYVSLEELRKLAEGPEGERLLSGWGQAHVSALSTTPSFARCS